MHACVCARACVRVHNCTEYVNIYMPSVCVKYIEMVQPLRKFLYLVFEADVPIQPMKSSL